MKSTNTGMQLTAVVNKHVFKTNSTLFRDIDFVHVL